MADKTSSPAKDAPDSPYVSELKRKRDLLVEKKKNVAAMIEPDKSDGHDYAAVLDRCDQQIAEIDRALKGAK